MLVILLIVSIVMMALLEMYAVHVLGVDTSPRGLGVTFKLLQLFFRTKKWKYIILFSIQVLLMILYMATFIMLCNSCDG